MAGRSKLFDAGMAIAVAAALVAVASLLRGETVAGAVRVIDGDTLAIDQRRIRLRGMDAPELAQSCDRSGTRYPCGEIARDALTALTKAAPVSCLVSGHDRYGRDLAVCRAGTQDLGAALVSRGLAVAYGRYGEEEQLARRQGLGLWAGTFEMPSDWRKRHSPPTEPDVRRRTSAAAHPLAPDP